MKIEEIRKNAPDGATHYDDVGIYYKVHGVAVYMQIDNDWIWYTPLELISEFEIKPLN